LFISETIFPANHLTGAKTQSPQPNTWLVLVNKIKQQPNYNTNNLNDTDKLVYSSETNHNKLKLGFGGGY